MNNLLVSESVTVDIEPGVSVSTWNFKAGEDDILQSEPGENTEDYFTLYYFLGRTSASITINRKELDCKVSLSHRSLITNSRFSSKIAFVKGSTVQCIRVAFSTEWLKTQFRNAGISLDVESLLHPDFANLYTLNFEENAVMKTLFEKVEAKESILIIKAHSFSLISYMLTHIDGDAVTNSEQTPNSSIREVEKVIVNAIKGKMPSIQQLAEDYSMSAPTLKRHFKRTYGASIYNYYLKKKMELAKEMLTQIKCVNEVSYSLGYESVSHFTAIFKKFHGYCPSKISSRSNQVYKKAS